MQPTHAEDELTSPSHSLFPSHSPTSPRPLSIIGHLSSTPSLSSPTHPSPSPHSSLSYASPPYTLLTLPSQWLSYTLSFLSPADKLTDVSHVCHSIHRTLTSLSSSFHDDYLSLPSPHLPPSLASPWFRGLSSVSAKTSAPAWFELDTLTLTPPLDAAGVGVGMGVGVGVGGDVTPPATMSSPSSLTSSPARRGSMSPLASRFSSIRSLSISLTPSTSLIEGEAGGQREGHGEGQRQGEGEAEGEQVGEGEGEGESDMFSGLHKWRGLRHLHITADDTDDGLTTASLDSALFAHQRFTSFTLLPHLHTLTLDATVRSDQLASLIPLPSLHSLHLTEREQRPTTPDDRWVIEETRMMTALARLARLVRGGRGLLRLRMPRFHFPTSADGFCAGLVEELEGAEPSPMQWLSLQGLVTKRGVECLASLPGLTSLLMGWGCEVDGHEGTLAFLASCVTLQHVDLRLVALEGEGGGVGAEAESSPPLPALSHVLSIPSLTSLSLHLPPHAWTTSHFAQLATLPLRRLSITGEPSGINSACPITHATLTPLITPLAGGGGMPLPHLKTLALEWLPLTDDALLIISSLSSLTSLSLVNCPYLSTALFLLLPSLPHLIRLKVFRCDVNLTDDGLTTASHDTARLRALLPHHPSPSPLFPALQVLECHLVHRLCCDVDLRGFARFLALLSPSTLHSFDFDSDYLTLPHFLLLSAFPHLRSLGTPCVDVYPYDDEAITRAKDSFRRVERIYYSRDYTRIHRGQRRRWRKERRVSVLIRRGEDAADADEKDEQWMTDESDDVDDIADEAEVDARREREQRWFRHCNGVEFRHREARVAFFDELRRVHLEQPTVEVVSPTPTTDTDADSPSSRVEGLDVEGEGGDEWCWERAEGKAEVVAGDEWGEGGEEEQQQAGSYESDDDAYDWDEEVPRSSSLSLVGRSLKLHSRRWKRDEKAAIKAKSCAAKDVDKSVMRGGRRGGGGEGHHGRVAVTSMRKCDHDLVRLARVSGLR